MKHHKGVEIPETFQELVDSIHKNYNPEHITGKILENRRKIIDTAKKFHGEAGTLTNSVMEEIERLEETEKHFFLMSSHQPNLMPYSGVIRKLTLLEAIKKRLEALYSIPVISLHLISDESFPDRWIKTTQLPDVTTKEGRLEISNPEIKKKPHNRLTGYGNYPIRISSIPKPSINTVSAWKEKIECWLDRSLKPGKRLARKTGYDIPDQQIGKLVKNAEEFMKILDKSYERARNYADLNSFMLSIIVNEQWDHRTLFARYSDAMHIFRDEILSLLFNYEHYFNALKEAKTKTANKKITKRMMPFWYHCNCGGMVNLVSYDNEALNSFEGICTNCEKVYGFSISRINSENSNFLNHISLRAIPYLLIRAKSLKLDLFVGGMGGLEIYYPEAKTVADRLGIGWPVIGIWNPHDHYAGLNQLIAFLSLKNNPSPKLGKKVFEVFTGKYSIADYALNVGLMETNQQWLNYLLLEESDLTADVCMRSVFDGRITEDFLNFINDREYLDCMKSSMIGDN
jgi:hypothetical protein